MKITIDDDRCQGHGRCYDLAPELFEPDEIGNSKLVDPSGSVSNGDTDKAHLAAANCPEQAITVSD